MESERELKDLRSEIRQVDEALLSLVARRQQLAREVGKAKLAHGLPIKDYRTEKDVIANSRKRASELGFPEDAAEAILKTLIHYSCQVQEEYQGKARARSSGSRKQIALIGGAGQMGRWLGRFFEAFGHSVSVFDPSGKAKTDFSTYASLKEAVQEAEVLVLATPITATAGVLESLVALKPKALVFDVCSLKSPLLPAIAKARKAGLKIASVHPMFGPSAQWLAGRNILICETGEPGPALEAEALFQESSATLVRVPLDRHDEFMGYLLGLSHLSSLVFGATVEKSGIAFETLLKMGSTTFQAQVQVTEPVVAENQDLYYEIQAENEFTPAVCDGMKAALNGYLQSIQSKDRAGFKALMEKSRRYFKGEAR
jgi:chorismate mutase / prephenate dehydrogenase